MSNTGGKKQDAFISHGVAVASDTHAEAMQGFLQNHCRDALLCHLHLSHREQLKPLLNRFAKSKHS